MKIPFFSSRQPQNLILYNLKVSPCCQPVNKQVYCPEHKHGADRKCRKQPCIIHAEDGQQAAHGGKCYDNMDNRHTQGKKNTIMTCLVMVFFTSAVLMPTFSMI